MAAGAAAGRRRLSAEFWAIVAVGLTIVGLGWQAYNRLDTRLDSLQNDVSSVKERLAHIEGWIQGRFREGANP